MLFSILKCFFILKCFLSIHFFHFKMLLYFKILFVSFKNALFSILKYFFFFKCSFYFKMCFFHFKMLFLFFNCQFFCQFFASFYASKTPETSEIVHARACPNMPGHARTSLLREAWISSCIPAHWTYFFITPSFSFIQLNKRQS